MCLCGSSHGREAEGKRGGRKVKRRARAEFMPGRREMSFCPRRGGSDGALLDGGGVRFGRVVVQRTGARCHSHQQSSFWILHLSIVEVACLMIRR
jgi:hypothetical protein